MPSDSDSSLPLAVWQTIERICTEYERGLRSGGPIDTADLLPQVPPEAQSVLLRELHAVAADYRRASPQPSEAEQSTQTYVGDAAAAIETATGMHAETTSALHPGTTTASLTWSKRFWWAAMVATCLFLLLLWGWQALERKRVQTIATSDPHVEVMVRGDTVVSLRDPIENRDYPLVGQRLIFAHAFTDRGLKLPLVDGTSMRLRKDGDAWTVIRAAKSPALPQPLKAPAADVSVPVLRSRPSWQSVLDFHAAHDLDMKGLRTWLRSLPDELTPIDINARVHVDPPRFNALAIHSTAFITSVPAAQPKGSLWDRLTRSSKPKPYRVVLEVAIDDVQKSFDQNDGSTWGIIAMAPYKTADKRFVHQIWLTDRERWHWTGRYWNDLPGDIENYRKWNLRPVQISFNHPPAKGGMTGMTFRPDDGLDWKCDFDLTIDQLEWKIKLAREKHWRPDALAAYDDGAGKTTLYSLVTVSNPSAARWDFRRDLSTEILEASISEFRTRALRPKVITSTTTHGGQPRYTGIWVEFTPPEPPVTTHAAPVSALDAMVAARSEPVGEVRRYTGFDPRAWITHCLFSPGGQRVIATSGLVREWDMATGQEVATYAKQAPFSWGLDVSSDGQHVVLAGDDAHVYLYSRNADGSDLVHWPTGQEGPYGFGAVFTPAGDQLLTWPHRGKGARLWNWMSQTLIREFPSPTGHWNCRVSPDGTKGSSDRL